MPKDVLLESVGDEVFVSVNGIRIARRADRPDLDSAEAGMVGSGQYRRR